MINAIGFACFLCFLVQATMAARVYIKLGKVRTQR